MPEEVAFPITLLAPGVARDTHIELRAGWSATWIENDGAFGAAFGHGTVSTTMIARIEGAAGALLVEGSCDPCADSAPLLHAARALSGAGALGVRVEQSKAAHEMDEWLRLIESRSLFRALVVLLAGGGVASCGMHTLGLPDASCDDDGSADLISSLCLYQMDEAPVLLSGHTFRPDESTPRRFLQRWPDARFPAGHPCHNPFGIWRMEPTSHRPAPNRLVSTFVPPLVALLLARERNGGRALLREEVLAIRDNGACIAMEPRDATTLERGRGYADIDPLYAWEQWSVARRAFLGS